MVDIRKNGQVVQPNVEQMPDDNGWPEPLTDPSTPYKIGVTNGKNGEQTQMDGMKTSQDIWSLTEGKSGGAVTPEADGQDGQRAPGGEQQNTSQNIWSDPSGMKDGYIKQPDVDGDTPVRSKDPLKTSQQAIGDIHDPEGDN